MDASPDGYGTTLLDDIPVDDDGSDYDLLFRDEQTKDLAAVQASNINWGNEPFHVGRVISPRESSEASGISALSRRSSTSSSYSGGSAGSTRAGGKTDRTSSLSSVTPSSSRSSSSNTRLMEGEGEGSVLSSSPAEDGDKFKTLHGILNLRESLSAIPDNSFHSTVTEEVSRSSKHGTEDLNSIREELQMKLMMRTAASEDEYYVIPPPPAQSQAQSLVERKYASPKAKSFLAPVPKENNFTFRTVSPEPDAATQSNPPSPLATTLTAPTLIHNDAESFHLTPMNKDLSLEDSTSAALPADLSMDVESLVRDSNETARSDVPFEVNTGSSKRTLHPTAHSPDVDVLSPKTPPNDEELRRSPEDVLCDLPHEGADELHQLHMISRATTPSSGCHTTSSTSSSEDMGHMIRSRMLDGSDFDSNCDTNSETISETHTGEKGRGSETTPTTPHQRIPNDAVMEARSQTSSDSSYHFVNLPLELQNDHVAMDVDSEVATASSADDIVYLEELYSDIFGGEEVVRHVIEEDESVSSGAALAMLGLFKDVESCHSSVVSFDSTDFLEDEQFDDGRSKACCSISMHDITTIHEEDEDDIADEDDRVLPVDTNVAVMPLNGELHLRRLELVSQGTSGTGTFSSVTDDSYMGGMSFDSSSLSERGSPLGFKRKFAGWKDGGRIDMSKHEDFTNAHISDKPGHTHQFNDEASQFTFESSHVSFGESACSYDSFSSESVKYMVDILKEEAERRRSKIQERIAKIRESTEKVSHTTAYAERLMKGGDEDSTL